MRAPHLPNELPRVGSPNFKVLFQDYRRQKLILIYCQ